MQESSVRDSVAAGFTRTAVMYKKGRGRKASLYRPWKIRTIVIEVDKCLLLYYDKYVLKGSISLNGVSVRHLTEIEGEGHHFAFEISDFSSDNDKLILSAGSNEEADEWVELIQAISQNTYGITSGTYVSLAQEIAKLKREGKKEEEQIRNLAYYRKLREKIKEDKEKLLRLTEILRPSDKYRLSPDLYCENSNSEFADGVGGVGQKDDGEE